jgi:histidyl-tRNA synthetase
MPKKVKNKSNILIQHPKGMHDILPTDQPLWEKVRKFARDIAEYYNFSRIDTPIIEKKELFMRTVGESTDIVEKQMFIVTTKSKEQLVLRPEITASIARAYVENGLQSLGFPLKVFTEGPLFRYERPQAGRFRQFHQVDFEIISNESDAVYDAELILVAFRFLEACKLKGIRILINSIGCRQCRPNYRKQLQAYYKAKKKELCADCVRRLETNPLRLLDCKEESCIVFKSNAPLVLDYLCKNCKDHFKSVLEYLEELKLPFELDHSLVRGLDYYTKTVFEIVAENSSGALIGGGRYDYLIELLGGKSLPAVGFAGGMERIIETIKIQEVNLGIRKKPKLFFIYIGALAKKRSLILIEELRKNNIPIVESLGKESLKGQLRSADKMGSPFALIFGQKEAFEETIIIRDLESGIQETVPLTKLAYSLKKKLKKH